MALRTRFELPHPLVLYKHLLRQSTFFPDDAIKYHIQTLVRTKFRQGQRCRDITEAEQSQYDAFTYLKRITRANFGAIEESSWVVGHTYGMLGPVNDIKAEVAHERRSARGAEVEAQMQRDLNFVMPRWGDLPDTRVYPVHPRVLLTAAPITADAVARLEGFARTLPASARGAYLPWAPFVGVFAESGSNATGGADADADGDRESEAQDSAEAQAEDEDGEGAEM